MEKVKGIILYTKNNSLIYYKNGKNMVKETCSQLFPFCYDIIYNSKEPEGIYKISSEDNIDCQISFYNGDLNFPPAIDVIGDVYIEIIKEGIDYKYRFITALNYYDKAYV